MVNRNSTQSVGDKNEFITQLSAQADFDNRLDVPANIVALCSNCHNEIHYGENARELVKALYSKRSERLKAAGIEIRIDELLEYY